MHFKVGWDHADYLQSHCQIFQPHLQNFSPTTPSLYGCPGLPLTQQEHCRMAWGPPLLLPAVQLPANICLSRSSFHKLLFYARHFPLSVTIPAIYVLFLTCRVIGGSSERQSNSSTTPLHGGWCTGFAPSSQTWRPGLSTYACASCVLCS